MLHLFALLGALPALIAMLIVDRADAQRPEPRATLRMVAFFGALSVIPAALVELVLLQLKPHDPVLGTLYYAFVVAALVEEVGKGMVIRWCVWSRPEFDERTDGIVYGARAGLGFALLENVVYLCGIKTMGELVGLFIVRALLTVPMHAVAGGFVGHFAAWRRFEGRGPGTAFGLLVAVVLHGSFDACILSIPLIVKARPLLALVPMLGAIAITVLGLVALRAAWQKALSADDRASLMTARAARITTG